MAVRGVPPLAAGASTPHCRPSGHFQLTLPGTRPDSYLCLRTRIEEKLLFKKQAPRYISIVQVCACIVKNCKIARFGLWKDVPVAYRIHWSMCWTLKPVLLILIRKDPLYVLDLVIRTDPHHFAGSGFATSLEEMDLDPRWTYYFGVLGFI